MSRMSKTGVFFFFKVYSFTVLWREKKTLQVDKRCLEDCMHLNVVNSLLCKLIIIDTCTTIYVNSRTSASLSLGSYLLKSVHAFVSHVNSPLWEMRVP